MAETKVEKEAVTSGKVTEVCRLFLTSADEGLAQKLQDEEYGIKYQWNRDSRKVARVDVPLAKTVHDLEEERLQKERFDFLVQQKKLAEEDEQMAIQLQKEEKLRSEKNKEEFAEKDAEIALQLQKDEEKEKEQAAKEMEYDDGKIALELQKEEILKKERNRIKLEQEDQALAQQYQEQEKQLSEMKAVERQLREQRHHLELELQHGSQIEEMSRLGSRTEDVVISERTSRPATNRDTVAMLRGGNVQGYRISDTNFLSEEERRNVLQMQDEELAKALQEHEETKARRAQREIASDIERHDAQLARIMQEVERLEMLKRQYQQQGDAYIILPVPHVESIRSISTSSTTRNDNFVDSGEYSLVSIPHDNVGSGRASGHAGVTSGQNGPPVYSLVDRSRNERSSTSSGESMRQLSSTGASPLNSPLPAPVSPPPPRPAGGNATHRPLHTSVSQSRVTETRVTSQPLTSFSPAVARDGSRQRPNNQNVSSTMPAHYQENLVSPTRRRSSKDKGCRQQ